MTNNPTYQIVVRNQDGQELGEFTEWANLKFDDKLNGYGTCEFQTPATSPELQNLISMRRYETLIKRNGSVVWAGEQANRYGSLTANNPNYLTIISHSFAEGLVHMYTPEFVRYDQVDEGEILKLLIDDFQAQTGGNRGYTFGTYLTGTLRDREYEWYNIFDAYQNMTNVINGPDFSINHDKEINIVKHIGVDRSKQVIFEWGVNFESVSISEDFSNPSTEVIVLGAGFGSEQVVARVVDIPSRGIYGLRQQRTSEMDISILNTLTARGEAVVRKYKQPVLTVDMHQLANSSPQFATIGLGDSVRLRIREGIFNIYNTFRIYGYNVNIDKDGKESVSYVLGLI